MNISLLINSCDKYEFIWDKFCFLFNKYWDHNIDIKKYFITEKKPIKNKNFIPILSDKTDWSYRINQSLNLINTDYVLWFQDDYFLRKQISKNKLKEYLNFVHNNKIDRLGICEHSQFYSYDNSRFEYKKLKQKSPYTISMQASIWNKDFFKSCLLEEKSENIWQFEIDGSKRLNSNKKHQIYLDIQEIAWYKEALRQGKYTDDYHKIINEENL